MVGMPIFRNAPNDGLFERMPSASDVDHDAPNYAIEAHMAATIIELGRLIHDQPDNGASVADPDEGDEGASAADPDEGAFFAYLDEGDEGAFFAYLDEGDEGASAADPDEGAVVDDWSFDTWDYSGFQRPLAISADAIEKQQPTRYINRKPAANLKKGIEVARAIGMPITHMISISCSGFPCHDNEISVRLRILISNYFTPWIRRPKGNGRIQAEKPAVYVWAIENPHSIYNIHLLVHLPNHRKKDFFLKFGDWVMACFGYSDPRTIHIQGTYHNAGAVKYILKGMSPEEAENYGIRYLDQGSVIGKRSGFSESIGPTARRKLVSEKIMPPSRPFYGKNGSRNVTVPQALDDGRLNSKLQRPRSAAAIMHPSN